MQSTQIGYEAGRLKWFPDPLTVRKAGNTRYQIADGIEQYAKYREEYAALQSGTSSIVQLSAGNFVGHHLVANFSDISVFLNYSGLALEKSISGVDDAYRVSVILDLPRDLVGFGGNVNSSERLMIVPPGAHVLMQSPPGKQACGCVSHVV